MVSIWIKHNIAKRLREKEPSLDIHGADQRILTICCEDFENYIEWLKSKNSMVLAMDLDELVDGGYTGDEVKQANEFVKMWISQWWAKWKLRVKIVVHMPKLPPCLAKCNKPTSVQFTEDERLGILSMAVLTLIGQGEICCTNIISTSIFNKIANVESHKNGSDEWSLNDKLDFTNKLIRELKRLSRVHGPLVFVRPDKRYYKLREFRNDGKTQSL